MLSVRKNADWHMLQTVMQALFSGQNLKCTGVSQCNLARPPRQEIGTPAMDQPMDILYTEQGILAADGVIFLLSASSISADCLVHLK